MYGSVRIEPMRHSRFSRPKVKRIPSGRRKRRMHRLAVNAEMAHRRQSIAELR